MLRAIAIATALSVSAACASAVDDDVTAGDDVGDDETTAGDRGVPGDCPPDPDGVARAQLVREGLPGRASDVSWSRPAAWTALEPFLGAPGEPAAHDGTDYVHDDETVSAIDVVAAAAGDVVYARTDCPQSSLFAPNSEEPACGWGWGNHVVVDHGGGVFTRYAHLEPGTVLVVAGDRIPAGQRLGLMGNSGDSDGRHLHFELGGRASAFADCSTAQAFDAVFDPALLDFAGGPTPDPRSDYGRIECPVGFLLESVNDAGGQLCSDGPSALGPFTAAMIDRCIQAGGGDACATESWALDLALRLFGDGECPLGAERDLPTGYCVEADHAFGPFPADLIAECIGRGGGRIACTSARWNADFMRRIYEALR